MPIKKYESNYDEESLVLHIDGKDTRIEFKGGGRYPFKHGGVYITENPENSKCPRSKERLWA